MPARAGFAKVFSKLRASLDSCGVHGCANQRRLLTRAWAQAECPSHGKHWSQARQLWARLGEAAMFRNPVSAGRSPVQQQRAVSLFYCAPRARFLRADRTGSFSPEYLCLRAQPGLSRSGGPALLQGNEVSPLPSLLMKQLGPPDTV